MSAQYIPQWLELTGRIGFVAKGILYVIIGVLSVQVALGIGGETANMSDALIEIKKQADPFGRIALGIVALGLIAHSIFRFAQSIFDIQNRGKDFFAIADRFGYFTSVVVYGGLAFAAYKIIFGAYSSSGNQKPEEITATVLSQPFGKYIVILAGAGILISGLFQLYLGITGNIKEKLDLSEMNEKEKKIGITISRIGLIARSVVFGILGVFLIQAAIGYDPQKAGGINKALQKLMEQPYGIYLLAIVSLGLVAYGGYCFVLARYRSYKSNP